MAQIQARISRETLDYLEKVKKDTIAESISDAVRLIITERMIKDRERGEISPFEYIPAPTPRKRKKRARKIEGEYIPAPIVRGASPPLHPPVSKEDKTYPEKGKEHDATQKTDESSLSEIEGFGGLKTSAFTGTEEEYQQAIAERPELKKYFHRE